MVTDSLRLWRFWPAVGVYCILFVEHGRSPDPGVLAWQDRLTPLWKRIGGGCHLNRPIDDLIVGAGLHVIQIERGYSRGPKPMTYLYKGLARRGD